MGAKAQPSPSCPATSHPCCREEQRVSGARLACPRTRAIRLGRGPGTSPGSDQGVKGSGRIKKSEGSMPPWKPAPLSMHRRPSSLRQATFALKAAPKTRRFPLIVMLRKGCLPPSELHSSARPKIGVHLTGHACESAIGRPSSPWPKSPSRLSGGR